MKYMIIQEMKEPWEENLAKALELEKKRTEKGSALTDKMLTAQYLSIDSSGKMFWVVDCEPEDVMKFAMDYRSILNVKVIPVMTRAEWAKL